MGEKVKRREAQAKIEAVYCKLALSAGRTWPGRSIASRGERCGIAFLLEHSPRTTTIPPPFSFPLPPVEMFHPLLSPLLSSPLFVVCCSLRSPFKHGRSCFSMVAQVTSGEYIQMSGRAGRRGLDDRGIVILMMDEAVEPPVAKEMIKGSADPLNSSFHLGYNMLLNLLRVEEADPEFVMARSFRQFQQNRTAPKLRLSISAPFPHPHSNPRRLPLLLYSILHSCCGRLGSSAVRVLCMARSWDADW